MKTKLTWDYGKLFCAMGILAMSQAINATPLECAIGNSDTVRVQLTADGKRPYDPTTTGFAHITFYNAVLGRLVHLKPNLTVEPGLLSEAYWDFKNQQYILRIREGLKFHNGRTVEAEDLDFSLARFFLTKTRADQVAFLKNIAGVQSLEPGMKYRPWMVSGIKKVGVRTVAVSLRSPNPAFLYSLSEGWISLVPREELRDDLTSWRSFPIGAGPYRVDHVVGGTVRVCRIAAQKDSPQVVEFVSDTKISADVVGFQPADFSQKSLTRIRGAGPIGFTGVFFNSNSELASNFHFRKAISLAIKRDALIEGHDDYSSLTEILTSNFVGRVNMPEHYDLIAAKKELALVPKDLLKRTIRGHWFSGRVELSPLEKQIVVKLEKQLAGLGLDVEFGPSNNPTFADSDKNTVLRIDDRGTAFADPLIIFRAFEAPAFLSPFFPKDNGRLKALLDDAAKANSLDVKANTIFALSKYFDENTILIPLYERKTVYWINEKKVADLGIQTGITFDLDRVRLVTKQ
jgi:ABC-type transport system substrate-binding protein